MKKRACLFLVLALVLVFAAFSGCGSDAEGGEDGDNVDGDSSNVDGDGQITDGDGQTADGDGSNKPDGDDGVIITPTDGDDDEDESDRSAGCTRDQDCAGDRCETSTGICKRRKTICEACSSNEECGYTEDLCLPDGICGYYCEDVSYCPTNTTGGSDFKCENVSGTSDRQCVFNDASATGADGSPCCNDNHCDAPSVCNSMTNKCYPGCKEGASACPSGQVCVDDSTDDRNGHCAPGCDDEHECEGGTVCIDNVCVEGDCAKKEHCPMEYLCDLDSRTCVYGCDNDENCFAYNECIDGICVEKVGCEGTWECSLAEVCTKELTGDVAPEDRGCCFNPKTSGTEECPNPFPEGPQKFCDVCTDTQNQNKECGTNQLGDNVCVSLQDEDGNPKGDFCLVRVDCSARTEGELDEGTRKCPRGYTCVKIDDQNLQGKFCIADCTKPEYQN